uniref:Bis(5'-adenosyl)-triphosphatase n=2 Tax=Biomphalaria glabrata TaxID=6526 RepID=A0A2C9JT74_BIOGL
MCFKSNRSTSRSMHLFITIIYLLHLSSGHSEKEYSLLLISFDGFRWNYLTETHAEIPTLKKLMESGVYAKDGLKNVFPTNTLPNHWSMVTGLYPESHGVLDNYIKDPNISKPFIPKFIQPDYQNDPRYYDAGGEPIWVTNQFQKSHGRSGSIMWWGSENLVKFMKPTLTMSYEDNILFNQAVDTIVNWFTSEFPINLGLLYFPEPDSTGHKYGPNSVNITKKIEEVDNGLKYLLAKLAEKDLLDDINIIITSDHGMSEITKENFIDLNDIVDPASFEYLGSGNGPYSSLSIFPKEGKLDEVYNQLKSQSESKNYQVFKAEEIPDRFNYKHNKRVPPILALAKPKYSFILGDVTLTIGGNHGYDNEVKDMHPFFIATGPSFKKGFSIDSLNTVDLYPLMCHLLGLHPAPNNGSMKNVSQLLQEGPENTIWTFGTYILVLIVIGSVGGVFTVAACRHHRYLKRRRGPLPATIKYSTPGGAAKAALLSADDDDDDEFDDANDNTTDDKMLELVTTKW